MSQIFQLQVKGYNWAEQIASIRNRVTEESNLKRPDNTYYRLCKNISDRFIIQLRIEPSDTPVILDMQTSDLYVKTINQCPFTHYARTVHEMVPQGMTLVDAIRSIPHEKHLKLFEKQTLIVLLIAESLRSDYFANAVVEVIYNINCKRHTKLESTYTKLAVKDWMPMVQNWEKVSQNIYSSITPESLKIVEKIVVNKSYLALTPEEKRFREQVDLTKMPLAGLEPYLQNAVKQFKVLNLPDPQKITNRP